MRSSPFRIPKLTPSTAARIRFALVKLFAEIPEIVPRARGRSGVLSPFRNGKNVKPSTPGCVDSSAPSMSPTVLPRTFNVCVTTFVAFIVHTNGSHPPDDEQNEATDPVASATGRPRNEYTVDEVPRLSVTT